MQTEGKTGEEVKENMRDLIDKYMKDPDTPKPRLEVVMSASVIMTAIPVKIKGVYHSKTSTPTAT